MEGLPPHKIREFRIVLPMAVEDYRVGHLWSVAEASKYETGGGEGVEVCKNEPSKCKIDERPLRCMGQEFTEGQVTEKIFHLAMKVPGFVRVLAPKGSLEVTEMAVNCYPFCRTKYSNPDYMKENFGIIVDTYYAPDSGTTENIFGLTEKELKDRHVVNIDIANDPISLQDYKAEWDPCLVGSTKANRPPLPKDGTEEWKKTQPIMCCYKLVRLWFNWWGLKEKFEKSILKALHRVYTNFHRQAVCWQDNYCGLTMEDIRKLEQEIRAELDRKRCEGEVRGMVEK